LVDAHRRHIHADKRSVCREVRMQLSDASAIHLAQQMATSATGPSSHLARKELRGRIRAILDELADSLGITLVAVKKRYLRALSRVRKLMDRKG
jgi:hypothetical protein